MRQVRDSSGAPVDHCFEIGGDNENDGFAGFAALKAAAAVERSEPKQPVAKPKPVEPKKLTTRQLVSQLKARLREVEREIKIRKSLEQERSQIARLLDAAQNENNLRRIRPTG